MWLLFLGHIIKTIVYNRECQIHVSYIWFIEWMWCKIHFFITFRLLESLVCLKTVNWHEYDIVKLYKLSRDQCIMQVSSIVEKMYFFFYFFPQWYKKETKYVKSWEDYDLKKITITFRNTKKMYCYLWYIVCIVYSMHWCIILCYTTSMGLRQIVDV